jgi:hypothetical protein
MRQARRVLALAGLCLLLSSLPAQSQPAATAAEEQAFFVVGFPTETTTIVIRLTDPAMIQQARDIVGDVGHASLHVMGTVVKAPAPYNPGWSYHLDSPSIRFFEAAIEVCDAHPLAVEEHLAEVCGAFLPGCVWCPWTSRLLAETHPVTAYLPLVLGSPTA